MHIICLLFVALLAASSAAAGTTPPVQLAARVELRTGSILIGLRNTAPHPLTVTLRVLAADGAALPVSSFGVTLAPRVTCVRYLPVRAVTRDEPILDCLVVYGGTNVLRQRVPCRSGALFRDSTANHVSTAMPHRAPCSLHTTPSGALELHVNGSPVLTALAAASDATPLLPWSVSNASWHAHLVRASSVLARATLSQRSNGRGDIVLHLLTDVLAPQLSTNDPPALTALVPAAFLSNTLIAARRGGTYIFTPAETLADPAIAAAFSGPAVDEWSVVTPRDWFIFSLHATQLALDPTPHGLRLRITSRAPWLPPFIPGRAHAIHLRLHLPVGILP